MSYSEIKLSFREDFAVVTINRPEKANCFTEKMYEEYAAAQRELADNPQVRAIILTGAGDKAFCAGIDLSLLAKVNSEFVRKKIGILHQVHNGWENHPRPVIAAINGACIGAGMELALSCDIRIASDKAIFSIPEVRFGLAPDMGGTQRLARLVGPGQAKRLILTGKRIDAREALNIGLVEEVVPADTLMSESIKMANMIANNAPLALTYAKKAINLASESSLAAGLLYEEMASTYCCGTEDKNEAMSSFFEKRPPKYEGK
ncbi:MAG TPA: enoyl-CoA hydratase-related protein [Clostridia bacterium]|nr:enoyl-CoA hydratase-related protein [Clostridia bacterium]